MIIRIILFFIAFNLLPNQALAKLDVDISEPNLKITTGFTGDTLTLFGTSFPKGDIVIIVKGPSIDTTIRRKIDILGLWIQAKSVKFIDVPQYYNVASSKSVFEITDEETRIENKIGINSLSFDTKETALAEQKSRFQEALIQNMQLSGLYSLTPDAVEYLNDHLFKTRIHMPANVPIGDYTIEAFLFNDGKIIDKQSHPFTVKQVGLAASIHDFAFSKPFLYGVLVILIAILSSFLAIILLRRD